MRSVRKLRAYRVAEPAYPEMEQELGRLAGQKISFTFVPHLLPMIRGILSTIYTGLNVETTEEEIRNVYRNSIGMKALSGSCLHLFCRNKERVCQQLLRSLVKWDPRKNRLIIISAIDNLVKGAAGQVLQNMNLMLGFKRRRRAEGYSLRP